MLTRSIDLPTASYGGPKRNRIPHRISRKDASRVSRLEAILLDQCGTEISGVVLDLRERQPLVGGSVLIMANVIRVNDW